jgi:hypothetical protein
MAHRRKLPPIFTGLDTGEYYTKIEHALQPIYFPMRPIPSASDLYQHPNHEQIYYHCRLRAPTFDPLLAQYWMQKCEREQGACGCRKNLPFQGKTHLVNGQRLCTKEISSLHHALPEYAALSYVWESNAQRLMLTKANKQTLSSEGGLSLNDLARTISDSLRCLDKLKIISGWMLCTLFRMTMMTSEHIYRRWLELTPMPL